MNSQNTSQKPTIIYLSGAGLRADIWDGVRAHVPLTGVALTQNRTATISLVHAVKDIVAQVQRLDVARYIVVAHSLGGVLGVELARQLGDKLAGFIAVSATIPAPGASFVNALPFPQNIVMPLILKLAGTKPPVSAIRKGLCSDLSEQQTTDIISAFTPEPQSFYIDKTTKTALPPAQYLYVRTLDDKQTAPSLQLKMAQQLPKVTVADISGGHLAMISHPDELAEQITAFANSLPE